MVKSICKVSTDPQGVTHSVSAYWLQPKREGQFPNLIVVQTTELLVYSVKKHVSATSDGDAAREGLSGHTLELEYRTHLHGEVLAITCLRARRHNYRDSLIMVFESVRFLLLAGV
jgi:hypothetical protein